MMDKEELRVLPEVSDIEAVRYDYFPTTWQAVIWRNWGYVKPERIANVLGTTLETIKKEAAFMGLCQEEPVKEVWEKQGYLTIIRNNWHLCTYEQLLILLNMTAGQLAFTLKEDDFLWTKLGEMKPKVSAPTYMPLTEEQARRTRDIVSVLQERFPTINGVKENGFQFLEEYHRPVQNNEGVMSFTNGDKQLRMVYPYFALYGDVLIDESIDPIPERLLMEYAKAGINGIWMQGMLYQLVEFPFDTDVSKGWEIRIRSLKKLVEKADKYGIGIYLYLNEPRSMSEAFFEKHPQLKGEQEGDFFSLCTSTDEVKNYLYQSVKRLFEEIPKLAGYFSISMSENLTNCYSRLFGRECSCPRCKERTPWEVVAEVNNLMAKGAHEAVPSAKTIVWTWAWPDEWAQKVVPLLTEGQILQCTSEEAMDYCIGGIHGKVIDYTMSLCGPGEKAKSMWELATQQGLEVSAKVQLNNTWELSSVPYIPVFDKIEQHIRQLKEAHVSHLQASWTLGGCPSVNLTLAAWLMEGKGDVKDFLIERMGETLGNAVFEAQRQLSKAFSHFPFEVGVAYFGPQNCGPMSPFFLQKTGYKASMVVGYPYDDIQSWASIYPSDVFEKEFKELCAGWKIGIEMLVPYQGYCSEVDEIILMAQATLSHFESAYHHIMFVNRRGENALLKDDKCKQELLQIVHDEMDLVQQFIDKKTRDSRIGYESSNHYFYTLQDLKEKLINLLWCEKQLQE